MIQNLNITGEQFLANLQSLQTDIARTQQQVSSGSRISRPSDDPAALGDVLQLESDLGRATQVSNNLNAVKGEVDTSESALETATQLIEQAQTIAVQGASSTVTPATQTALAQQVQGILSQLVSVSQTQWSGEFVFSGDASAQPAYQLNLSSPTGVDRLIKTASTRQIQDATGLTFADAKTAQDIFDHRNPDDSIAADNVFSAVNSLRVALAGNNQTGVQNAAALLQTASDYLSQQLAFYGAVQDRVSSAQSVAQKFQLQDQTALAGEKNTDVASAAVDLTQEQASLQAALQAEASLPRGSLFALIGSAPLG